MKPAYNVADITVSVPHSNMELPFGFVKWVKFLYWKLYTPFHPFVRDVSLALGIMHHEGRQQYLLGTLAPTQSINELVTHLVHQGYRNHFIAWTDDEEIMSLRKTVGFDHQYHIRLFSDGEVRAHYEYTPEAYPLRHMHQVGMEARRKEFEALIGNRIIWSDLSEETSSNHLRLYSA